MFVVTSPTTGETKQVGSNCLELFLGVKPAGLWALTDDAMLEELSVDDDELAGWRGPADGASVAGADDALALTMQVIAEDGEYLSRSNAGFNEKPTAEKVLERLAAHGAQRVELTDAERAELADVYAWIDAEAATPDSDRSSYMANLCRVLAVDEDGLRLVSRTHVAIAASAVSTYRNHKARELRKATEDEAKHARDQLKKQEYLAPPGTKLKGAGIEATILSVRLGRDYGYGAPLHVTMMDDAGHVLYWKCSGIIGGNYVTADGKDTYWSPDQGSRVAITSATVKDNRVNDYNGDWETILTRTKLEPTPAVLASMDGKGGNERGESVGR